MSFPRLIDALTQRGLALMAQATVLSSDAAVPDWIEVLPSGEFQGVDGRGPWRLTDPAQVIAASMATNGGQGLCIDYNHQTVFAVQNGGPSPAAGWVDRFEARNGAIWAHVTWTEDGARAIAARHYRFVSPTFFHDKAGNVQKIISVGLVNSPNLAELPAINAATGDPMDELLNALRQALGLPADADQGAILSACQRYSSGVNAMSALTPLAADLGMATNAGIADVVAAARTRIAGGIVDPAKFVPMAAFTELQQEVAVLKTTASTNAAQDAVAAAMRAGKVSPALKDWALTYAAKDPSGFAGWVAASPAIIAPNATRFEGDPPKTAPVADETVLAVCARLGITPAAYAKAAQGGDI